MDNHLAAILSKLRFIVAGVLVIVIFGLLSMIASITPPKTTQPESAVANDMALMVSNGAKVVAAGVIRAANDVLSVMQATGRLFVQGAQKVGHAVIVGIRAIGHALWTVISAVGRAVGSSVLWLARALWSCVLFVVHIPTRVASFITGGSAFSAVVRPADHMEIPVIDPDAPELQAAINALPPTSSTPAAQQGPQWPMHGAITTYFGVAHWPYQVRHTGMDISDGTRRGTTPIKPYRPGVVTEVVHEGRLHLGNHVVVDHGNGVTSVYGHLDSTAVAIGQQVDLNTILGYEGTTGVSTGVHLHFEIRVQGQAADPRQFISGSPAD
jgi:hypothetical protein